MGEPEAEIKIFPSTKNELLLLCQLLETQLTTLTNT
jgi:hypothetical protein